MIVEDSPTDRPIFWSRKYSVYAGLVKVCVHDDARKYASMFFGLQVKTNKFRGY
jgi:hypothetical protein